MAVTRTGPAPTLKASTVAHNSATEGGGAPAGAGIANGGLAVIRSSLIMDNAPPGGIGAPSSAGTVILRATTVTRNAPDNCEPAGTIRGCTG